MKRTEFNRLTKQLAALVDQPKSAVRRHWRTLAQTMGEETALEALRAYLRAGERLEGSFIIYRSPGCECGSCSGSEPPSE